MSETPSVDLQSLPEVRRKTEAVAKLLQDQLTHHLEVLRPAFAPERVLGRYAGGRGESSRADRAFAELQQKYKEAAKAVELPGEFDPSWLNSVSDRLDLYQWEYTYEAKTGGEAKAITISCPLRWMLTFGSDYSAAQVRQVLSGKQPRRAEYLRQFVLNVLLMGLIISRQSGVAPLLADLRYELKIEPAPELGKLPVVTITSCLPSFRPTDELILAATTFSGIPAFIELLDVNAARNLPDPLQARIGQLLA